MCVDKRTKTHDTFVEQIHTTSNWVVAHSYIDRERERMRARASHDHGDRQKERPKQASTKRLDVAHHDWLAAHGAVRCGYDGATTLQPNGQYLFQFRCVYSKRKIYIHFGKPTKK